MGRHRTQDEKRELGDRARELRAAGRSRREIQAELGIGDDLAKAFLRDVPLPDRLLRPRAKDDVREAAVALRLAGRTYDEIAAELGVSKSSCSLWLRDLPHPAVVDAHAAPSPRTDPLEPGELLAGVDPVDPPGDGTSPDQRTEARRLRGEGLLLKEIAECLGVSGKTVYYWTWDLPLPPRAQRPGGDKAHMDMMRRRYWDRVLAERDAERQAVTSAHAQRVGGLSQRELELLAVVAYWCEGCKSKPWERREQVTFINSDPGLILLWLAYLDSIGFPSEHRRFNLSIHESADIASATLWWAELVGVDVEALGAPQLKRHNPKTVRKNVDEAYVGCLVVRLVQCRTLYQQIDGVWQGIMGALPHGSADDLSRVV